MAKVHKMSSFSTIPELDLFSVNQTQGVVERNVETEYRPIAPIAGSNFIQFRFHTPLDSYLMFHDSYFYLKFRYRLRRADGSKVALEDWERIVPSNYLLNTMFKQVELIIGDNELVKSPQTYAYKSLLEATLGFSLDAKNTHLQAAFYQDNDGKRTARITPNSIDFAAQDYSSGKLIELEGRLHLDMTFQGKALLGGSVVGLKLTPHDPAFFTKVLPFKGDPAKPSDKGPDLRPYIELIEACMETKSLKCYSHLVDAHEKALRVATAKYPLTRCDVKTLQVPAQLQDVILDNVVNGLLPRRVFIMMVDNEAFNGSYSTDAFRFEHFNLCHLATYMNGIQYPSRAFQPDFENDLYVREYMSLFKALNQNTTDTLINIDMNTFKRCRAIFAINYSPDLSNGMGAAGHASPQQFGPLSVHLKFKKALAKPINVIVYCEYDTIIEIDAARAASMPF